MKLSTTTGYAIRIMGYLSKNKRKVTVGELSKNLQIPSKYIYKIIAKLKVENLVMTYSGVNGGCKICCNPLEVTLFEIIVLFESSMKINCCLENDYSCTLYSNNDCNLKQHFNHLQLLIDDYLKNIKIIDLI